MSSGGTATSSFALIAFTSTLTVLISHLAVRQEQPHIIQQPASPPPASAPVHQQPSSQAPPPPPSPPPPPPPAPALPPQSTYLPPSAPSSSPIVLIGNNGSNILYTLVLLVLLFGLSGVWLEGKMTSSRLSSNEAQRRDPKRAKKKGYVSSSDDSDSDEAYEMKEFPGSWTRKDGRTDGKDKESPKDWKEKMKEKVTTWASSSSFVKGKGKRTEEGGGESELDDVDESGKTRKDDDCCGCCRILLERCEAKERDRQQEEKREKEKEQEKREMAESKRRDAQVEDAWNAQIGNSSKEVITSEKTSTTESTTIITPANVTEAPQTSNTTTKAQKKTVEISEVHAGESSRLDEQAPTTSTIKGKSKGKEKAATVKEQSTEDNEAISEPPLPMPETPGKSVDPLPEDTLLSTNKTVEEEVAPSGSKGKKSSDSKNKNKDEGAKEDKEEKRKEGREDRGKEETTSEAKETDNMSKGAKKKEVVEASDAKGKEGSHQEVAGGSKKAKGKEKEQRPILGEEVAVKEANKEDIVDDVEPGGGGKIKKGISIISGMTREITEEVLKHVLLKLDIHSEGVGGGELNENDKQETDGKGKGGQGSNKKKEDTPSKVDTVVDAVASADKDKAKQEAKDASSKESQKKGESDKKEAKETKQEVEAEKKEKDKREDDAEQASIPQKKGKKKSKVDKEETKKSDTANETNPEAVRQSSPQSDTKIEGEKVTVVESESVTIVDEAKTSVPKADPEEAGKVKARDEGHGTTKQAAPPTSTTAPVTAATSINNGLNDTELALLKLLKRKAAASNMYLGTAAYLADEYPGIVDLNSAKVKKELDDDFVMGSKSQDLKVRLPWYSYGAEESDSQPHQDGEEASVSEGKKKEKKGSTSKSKARISKAREDREAIQRALDLYKLYKGENPSPEVEGASKERDQDNDKDKEEEKEKDKHADKAKEGKPDADAVLQTLIEALVRAKQDSEETRTITEWKRRVAEETAKKSSQDDDDEKEAASHAEPAIVSTPSMSPIKTTPPSCGFPNVIPLEAVNASSLAAIAAINKQLQNQQHPEKSLRLNEAIKSVALDARKNINFLKEDFVDLREGATSKAKTLKSLLKKRNSAPGVESNEGVGEEGVKRKSRKSVRLQDAAGRGEGPRDATVGETEEQARYRRLREMAGRLND